MSRTLYRSARFFTAEPSSPWAEAIVVEGDRIVYAGPEGGAGEHAASVDLGGRLVVPGFVDAHTHLMLMGDALGQVPLTDARDLETIQERLRAARAADPSAPRLYGRGWLFDSIPGGAPAAAMIDAVVADVPVYLDANDYHSCWVNSAALRELGIDDETPDPLGGRIGRDANGHADGLLFETAAQQYVWAHNQAVATDADRDAALERALDAYSAAGVTGAVDMALDEAGLATMRRLLERGGSLPVRIAAHWFVGRTGNEADDLAQVARAAELAAEADSPWLRVVGIKLVLDGVIDACTAAMKAPYADGSNAEPIWSPAALKPIVAAADAAGLQIAQHAIGDRAGEIALDALEHAIAANGARPRLHRIEHLETVTPESVARLARLGVTASMQPVHADPAVQANWAAQLGDERVDRGYPWPEFPAAGALLAFGTDAPTAPHHALPNMFVAATRRSALEPSRAANHPELAVPLAAAIGHATRDAAASVGDADRGRLVAGQLADFAVIDGEPFAEVESLLTARVVQTIVGGRTVFEA